MGNVPYEHDSAGTENCSSLLIDACKLVNSNELVLSFSLPVIQMSFDLLSVGSDPPLNDFIC